MERVRRGTTKSATACESKREPPEKLYDEDAGMYYFNARWYDSETGRFVTEDPARDGVNWYAYCGGNPVNRFDWTGLEDAPFNWSVGKYDKAYIIKGVDTGDKWYNNAADITINAAAGIWNAAAMAVNTAFNAYGYAGEAKQAAINWGDNNIPDYLTLTGSVSRDVNTLEQVIAMNPALAAQTGAEITNAVSEIERCTRPLVFNWIGKASIHNRKAGTMTFGKYLDGTLESGSYVAKAKQSGDTYFSLGKSWDSIKRFYKLNDDDMFQAFNVPAIDDAISHGKTLRFTHNPVNDMGALGKEYAYIMNNKYKWNPETLTAVPNK